MGVTIYDIARDSGVSIATVSRVFNDSPRVSDSTRSLVIAAAERLGYQPHVSARSLARRRASIVSVVIPMLTNYFFVEVLRGLQDRMAESEFDLLVFSARTMEEMDLQIDRALQRGRSAGVLVFSTPITNGRAERLLAGDQPVVLVDSSAAGFDSVSTDSELGGALAVRHLIACGARRIALIMGSSESVPSLQRQRGYLRALGEAQIPFDSSLMVQTTDPLHHGYSEAAGFEAMQQLLSLDTVPDAVFATSDIQAVGALQALTETKVRVPQDMLVVGFDDIMLSRHIGLTTLRQPMYEMGTLAAERLIHRISNGRTEPAQTVLSPRLVVRHTTDETAHSGRVARMTEALA